MSPFVCPELARVAVIVDAAHRAKLAAQSSAVRLIEAETAVAVAEDDFADVLSESAADHLISETNKARNLRIVVGALEARGGPEAAFDRAVNTAEVYSLLASAFDQRRTEIAKAVAPLRKALGARLATLAEAGTSMILSEADGQVRDFRIKILSADTGAQAELQHGNYCRNWNPQKPGDRTFADLFACANTPLPV